MSTRATSWTHELRCAAATGAAGGVLLGAREGIATFAANSFADAQHHALAYLIAPVAVWFVLGPLLLLPLTPVARWLGGGSSRLYATALAAIATVLALLPSIENGIGEMHATGATPTVSTVALLVAYVGTLAIAAALLTRAAVAWHAERRRVLRCVSVAAAIAGVTAWAWTASFMNGATRPVVAAPTRVAARAPRADAPNVLLVSIDTLRADELGAYGSRLGLTPALDRLAADGVTVEQAIAASPWTLPALASVLTGFYPRHHGAGAITNRHDPLGRSALAPEIPTLADSFSAAGYRTHAIVTNPYLLVSSGLAAGYQSYDNLTFLSEASLAGRTNAGQWLLGHLAPQLTPGDRGVDVSDRAVRWLSGLEETRPFLLWLHYIDPHGPYGRAGTSRHKSFRGEVSFGAGPAHADALGRRSPDPVRLRSGEVRLDNDEKLAMRALYRDEVVEVDRQIARVLRALDDRDLADRTLVVVVSDHGEEFWDHGGVEHGHTLYDELLRAVWLMRWPQRLPAGRRIAGVASTVDVTPTVQHIAGLDVEAVTDGVSLLPQIDGEAVPARAVLSENLLFAEERVAVRTDTAKLIRWENGKEEAYDLVHDPGEQRDLAATAFAEPLRFALEDVEKGMAPAVTPVASAVAPAAALRALGYLQ